LNYKNWRFRKYTLTYIMKIRKNTAIKLSLIGLIVSSSVASAQSINLGDAASFGVLGASTVTNTGGTTINGDLGVSPGTAITGFLPGTYSGGIHTGTDSLAVSAKADARTAYNDLAAQTATTNYGPIHIFNNDTLTPGVFNFPSSGEIAAGGTLTLDGDGTYIFQVGSTWVAKTLSSMVLTGGARAENIFFQVGSSATLGTYTTNFGTFIADQSITAQTGATIDEGRLLALVAAVTLDTNTIAVPTSIAAPVVPEPSTFALLGLASLGLLRRRR
jgi:type VI secretion system secreted protein VgrG